MMRWVTYGLLALCGVALLTACSTEKKSLGIALQTNDLVYSGVAESLPDKVNVYNAMARAAKYGSDASAQNMLKKIYDGNEKPEEIAEGILLSGSGGERLYNASRAMDFADIYAMSILTDNPKYVEDALYAKSAQNLSLAAIGLHREVIFAEKEIKDIDRLANQQGKILKKLNNKMNSGDDLTEKEINYRKNLEVALNNLEEIKKQLVYVRSEYMQLINTKDNKLSLEGKRFYELDDFDKRYNPGIFQDSAVSNRREFTLAKEKIGGFNVARARRQAFVDYPPVARLDINGLEIEDNRYENELFNKAKLVTMNLLGAVEDYRSSPANERLRQKAFDELAALVMTQVEVAYRLVEKASYDYDSNNYKISETKEIIKKLRQKNNMPEYERIDLLNKQIELVAYEQREAQILSERASALRNLYYLSGLSPFDKNVLKGRIKDIEGVLRQSFNKDLVTMLSAVKENPRWDDGGNAWAHKDNWLEELIDGSEKVKKQKSVKNKSLANSVKVENSKKYSLIQLGAYTDLNNAEADKKAVVSAVDGLSRYDIFVEQAIVNGTLYYRLQLKPEPEFLHDLCNQIVSAGFDCILK